MPLRLYLVRHGETEWSLSGRHTGRTNIPLTARGEDEARELAQRLRDVRFAHVLTSPRQRARRTCGLAGLGTAAEIEPALAEWDYGDYEGQCSVDIRRKRADWNIFRDGCPNGEMPAQVSDRADRLIALLRALDGNVALFSHGQFGCVLAARWIGLPLLEARHFSLGTASLSILGHDPTTPTYQWQHSYGYDYLYAGSFFTHQLSHIWIDFRGIQDVFMRDKGMDYFENSRRATYVQQQYAIDNPLKFKGYGRCCWGITASDGPGPETIKVDGIVRQFFDYIARGVPYGPDDGTIAPWAVVASLPFAPEFVLPAMDYFIYHVELKSFNPYGFKATFNPTHPDRSNNPFGWVSPWQFGLHQGPITLMAENYRSGLLWRLMRNCPYIVSGLRRADFTGGWL